VKLLILITPFFEFVKIKSSSDFASNTDSILETKNSWGKNEIRQILLEVVSGIRVGF
jgi:hypothetical protein